MQYYPAFSIFSYFTDTWKPCKILNLYTNNYGVTIPSPTHLLLAIDTTQKIIDGINEVGQYTYAEITWGNAI